MLALASCRRRWLPAAAADSVDRTLAAGLKVELPVYKIDRANLKTVAVSTTLKAGVQVQFENESAKINLNHAPPRVLQSVLAVDGETARRIRASLPVEGAAPSAAAWMVSTDELVTRGLITPEVYAKVSKDLLSVDNVADHQNPEGYLNINAASADTLAAVFDITKAAAEDLAKKRPFASYADAVAATGKDPSAFNLAPAPDGSAPKELSLQSRCFRIVSRAKLDVPGSASRSVEARAEAVVVFAKDGTPCVTSWSETPEPKTAEQKPAAQ